MEDRIHQENGQSLIEFALILPLIFLLVVNIVNFGAFLHGAITIAGAARVGAQYAITGGAAATRPATPTNRQVADLIMNDTASLPGTASMQMQICRNNNGTATCTCMAGDCSGMSAPPPDPDDVAGAGSAFYVLASVDLIYTFQPLIPLWSVPSLGIYSTLPPSRIHRRAVMRMMQ